MVHDEVSGGDRGGFVTAVRRLFARSRRRADGWFLVGVATDRGRWRRLMVDAGVAEEEGVDGKTYDVGVG
jgi:hypothetical protein